MYKNILHHNSNSRRKYCVLCPMFLPRYIDSIFAQSHMPARSVTTVYPPYESTSLPTIFTDYAVPRS
ncbi:hypothetical protein ABKN59_010110 [Abortiporus biennis]